MRTLLTLTLTAAFGFALPTTAHAQKKKKAEAAPAAEAKKPEAASAPAPEKKSGTQALPMNARADAIDPAAKTFTMKRKDGVEIKHTITDQTEIKNGDAAAKLEDIKVGDWVSGSRTKKSTTDYEVVKITKFGPRLAKGKAAAKTPEGEPVKAEPNDSVPEAKKP